MMRSWSLKTAQQFRGTATDPNHDPELTVTWRTEAQTLWDLSWPMQTAPLNAMPH